jgi:8-oxo-dGTP pyrophosphatase MutT (NUDIX family)
MTTPPEAIRPAATIILARDDTVLMGQRGEGAVFMPSKYVFPGGGVDAGDAADPAPLAADCIRRLSQHVPEGAPAPGTLARAALRELAEETGLGLAPAAPLRFIFRAITPPGRSRRFDARFFLADAAGVIGNPHDFSRAEDELSHLHWVPLADARALDLPFITEVVLAEVTAILRGADQQGVPFFDNTGSVPTFRRIT